MVRYDKPKKTWADKLREAEEEKKRLQEKLREKKEVPEPQPYPIQIPSPGPTRPRGISRRNFIAGLGAVGAVSIGTALTALAMMNSGSRPTGVTYPTVTETQNNTTTIYEPQTAPQTPAQQTTFVQETTPLDPYQEAETWPQRNSLQELKDAQFQMGSKSKYTLPTLPNGTNYVDVASIPSNFDEVRRCMGDAFMSTTAPKLREARVGLFFDTYFNTDVGVMIFFANDGQKSYFSEDTGYFMRVWNPSNPDARVLVKNENGMYKRIYQPHS